eukprot:TRINITY_DN4586_c0_g3_i2.p1 TRINITY_DN4586_c0_g3~~TRINITY_DN4586_c0_g3_i2.p1  ORF type:complete len:550 (+),score=125.39 TRINITY_DN4586_c0_g3_i2:178-1827(+)
MAEEAELEHYDQRGHNNNRRIHQHNAASAPASNRHHEPDRSFLDEYDNVDEIEAAYSNQALHPIGGGVRAHQRRMHEDDDYDDVDPAPEEEQPPVVDEEYDIPADALDDQPGEDQNDHRAAPHAAAVRAPLEASASNTEETKIARICRKLNGKWEGYSMPSDKEKKYTQWRNCQLEFHPDVPPYDDDESKKASESSLIAITGTGLSIWNDQEVVFELSGTLDIADFSFVMTKTHKNFKKGKKPPTTDYEGTIDFELKLIQGHYEKGKLVLKRLKSTAPKPKVERAKSKEVADELTGSWEGISTRTKDGSVTSWRNVNISFHSGMSNFAGSGVSEWKSDQGVVEQVDFEILGKFLDKEGEEREATITKINFVKSKSRREIEFRVHVNLKQAKIDGTYSHGSLSLRRVGDLKPGVYEAVVDQKSEHPSSEIPSSGSDDRLQSYKLFLEGVILAGVVNEKHEKAIDRTRKTYNITDAEHLEVLKGLGVTAEGWEDMKNTPKKTCIICYDREINCVLLPCGHLALCHICAKSLNKQCPICRVRIQSVTMVYQA